MKESGKLEIRTFAPSDLPRLVDLTIETFRPFYEGFVRRTLGDELFELHHGDWEQDYRSELPTLHDPAAGRHVAVAQLGDVIAGYAAWKVGEAPGHGQIYLLTVDKNHRRREVGRQLCLHAIDEMKGSGVTKVGVFTGGDRFHAPARALYEALGFTKIPIVGYLKRV